jgi:protein SCO1
MTRWIVRHPLLAQAVPLAAFLAAAGLLLAIQSGRRVESSQDPGLSLEGPDDFGAVGPFAFVERSGKAVTQDTLRGKVWIAACFFTCCTDSCPKLSAALARLQAELAGEPDVRLVSLTVDPAHDTTETLTRYAEAYNADADRWLFLTGSEGEVRKFVRERLHLGAEPNAGPDATPGNRVLHDPRLTLIDRGGHIRGYFVGTDPEAVGRLKVAAVKLARGGR